MHVVQPELDDQLSENRKAALSGESVERRLHRIRELLIATTDNNFVLTRLRTVPRRPVDWFAQLHCDLRRKRPRRNPPWNDTKRRSEYERPHLDTEHPVEAKTLCDALSSSENDHCLVGTY